MPHEIDLSTGKAACFVAGEPPWHKLGVVVSEAQTSSEAIHLAGLQWQVEQWPLQAYSPRMEKFACVPVPGRVANVRSDTHAVLGDVGSSYRPLQNNEAFDFMDALVGERLAMFETAGALHGGKKVWLLARLPKELRAGPEDVIEPYLLLSNTHDGTQALRILPTSVRVVCQNTLNLALGEGDKGFRIPHYQSLPQRVEEARSKLGIVTRRLDGFQTELDALVSRTLNAQQVDDYFDALFPTRPPARPQVLSLDEVVASQQEREAAAADLLAAHWEEQDSQARRNAAILELICANFENERNTLPGIEGTAWAAFNAVSEWADHRTYRGKNEAARLNNQLNSIWFGDSAAIKAEAYQSALALTNAV